MRAQVAANLRSVSVLVLDSVIGAGEGHRLDGLHVDGILGAVDRDLGDGLALNVVVRAVDDDGLRARGDLDVRVGLVDREGAGSVGLARILRRVGLAESVDASVLVSVRGLLEASGADEAAGAEESPPETLAVWEQPVRATVATARAAAAGRKDFRDMVSPFRMLISWSNFSQSTRRRG